VRNIVQVLLSTLHQCCRVSLRNQNGSGGIFDCRVPPLLPRWLGLLLICSAPGLATPLCVTGTLADYIALGSGGCSLPLSGGTVTVADFSYSFVSGTILVPDTDITIGTTLGDTLLINSPDFSVSGSDSTVFQLAYVWNYTWGAEGLTDYLYGLGIAAPVYPGLAEVSTLICEGAAFSPSCPSATDRIVVSSNGLVVDQLASSALFPGLETTGIQDTIELDGNGASAAMYGVTQGLILPEPSTLMPCLLLGGFLFSRLRLSLAPVAPGFRYKFKPPLVRTSSH
jgi:hypothetical protein